MVHRFKFYPFIIAAGIIFLLAETAAGQDKLSLEPGADFVSRYIWRGTDYGNSPAIQPSLELGYKGFAFGAWGSYTTNDGNFQETDLYVSYTIKEMFTIMVTDYFLPDGTASNNNYFEYDLNQTGHVFEGALMFNGTEKIPVSLMVATNFAGADAMTYDNELQYSTYIELGYSAAIQETGFDFFIGGTPTKPDREQGETGYYGPYEGIVNIGITATREIPVTDKFSLPVYVSVITNPQQENIFFVLGISL
jgi:hypothetical protein